MILKDFKNIPFRTSDLSSVYPNHKDYLGVAKRLEKKDHILRLKKGLYVLSPKECPTEISDFLIANHLYGPSYISCDSALRWYGLIPEAVFEIISVTTGGAKTYKTPLGTFRFIHTSETYYSVGVTEGENAGAYFLIATPEKALCDKIIFTPYLNLRYRKEILQYLDESLRFDMDKFYELDVRILKRCAEESSKQQMINQIINIIENGRSV